jgi:hypothetical protein
VIVAVAVFVFVFAAVIVAAPVNGSANVVVDRGVGGPQMWTSP